MFNDLVSMPLRTPIYWTCFALLSVAASCTSTEECVDARREILTMLDGVQRIEFTYSVKDQDSNVDRYGPVVIDSAVEVKKIVDELRKLKDPCRDEVPYYANKRMPKMVIRGRLIYSHLTDDQEFEFHNAAVITWGPERILSSKPDAELFGLLAQLIEDKALEGRRFKSHIRLNAR